MAGFIETQFNNYQKKYPLYTREAIADVMLKDGVISAEVAKKIKQGISLFIIENSINAGNTNFSTTEIMGGYFSKTPTPLKTNSLKIENKKHPIFKHLLIDSKGNIDMSQFTYEGIRKRFPKNKYIIKTTKEDGRITYQVFNKQNSLVAEYRRYQNNYDIMFFNKNRIDAYELIDTKCTFYFYSDNNNSIEKLYNKNEQLERCIYKKNERFSHEIIYQNGFPYKRISADDSVTNLLAIDLKNDIFAKNKYGFPTTRKTLSRNVLKRITTSNVYEVLNAYREITGNELISDIYDEIGLKLTTRKKLIKHIEQAVVTSKNNKNEDAGICIAHLLYSDMHDAHNSNLESHYKLINQWNVLSVVKEFYKISAKKADKYVKIPNGIISAVSGLNINDDLKNKIINHIKNAILNITSNKNNHEGVSKAKDIYIDDIKADIKKHSKTETLDVDVNRLCSRNPGIGDSNNKKANGKIDGEFAQGFIGDCWLIAGLMSILDKPKGREYLNSLLTYDEVNKFIIVNLKGVNKKYKIPVSIIEKSNHLARGDMDVRVFEIAIDQYMKEQAYKSTTNKLLFNDCYTPSFIDIEGNEPDFLYKLLIGNNPRRLKIDFYHSFDFNNKDYAYTLSTGSISNINIQDEKSKENTSNCILDNHTYDIIGSDKKYIYLKDPNFNIKSDVELQSIIAEVRGEKTIPYIIKVSREDLKNKKDIYISEVKIP